MWTRSAFLKQFCESKKGRMFCSLRRKNLDLSWSYVFSTAIGFSCIIEMAARIEEIFVLRNLTWCKIKATMFLKCAAKNFKENDTKYERTKAAQKAVVFLVYNTPGLTCFAPCNWWLVRGTLLMESGLFRDFFGNFSMQGERYYFCVEGSTWGENAKVVSRVA